MTLGFSPAAKSTTRFELPVPDTEVGHGIYQQYEYAVRHPGVRPLVLVSCWGEERKVLGFRLSRESKWHVEGGSGHWCRDCVGTDVRGRGRGGAWDGWECRGW